MVPMRRLVGETTNSDANRWTVTVELTFDIDPADIIREVAGDEVADFASRGFSRIRPRLEAMVGKGKPFAHYHVVKPAAPTIEFD